MVTFSVRNSITDGVSSSSVVGKLLAGKEKAGNDDAGNDAAGNVLAGNEDAGSDPDGNNPDSSESFRTPRILAGGGGGGGGGVIADGSTVGWLPLSLLQALISIAVVTIPITRATLLVLKACMMLFPKIE
jgi:hypothetical protein